MAKVSGRAGRRGRGSGHAAVKLTKVLRAIRDAKEVSTGRLFDELHYAEGRLDRAGSGRRSSFASRVTKAGTKGVKALSAEVEKLQAALKRALAKKKK